MIRLILFLFLCVLLRGQALTLYSEFRRIDDKGGIIAQDRGGTPREILSPALIRNAWHTLRVSVNVPADKRYALHVAQNPDDTVRVRLYRETGGGQLERASLPVQGAGGTQESFLLDLHVAETSKVFRFRLEAQLNDGETWYIAPMEMRIYRGIVPEHEEKAAKVPAYSEPSSVAAREAIAEFVCGRKPVAAPQALTVGWLTRRNALQDVALAQSLLEKWEKDKLVEAMVEAGGFASTADFCSGKPSSLDDGPEWYLHIRDFLYSEASH